MKYSSTTPAWIFIPNSTVQESTNYTVQYCNFVLPEHSKLD